MAAAEPRGGRGAYTAAIDRERYGRGGGGGGINRYPDVSGRERQGGGGGQAGGGRAASSGNYARQDASYSRGDRTDRPAAPRSGDPWSEVPPELEEMLRAQLAQSPKGRKPERATPAPVIDTEGIETMTLDDQAPESVQEQPKPARGRRGSARTAAPGAPTGASDLPADVSAAEATAPKRRTTRKKADVGDAVGTETSAASAAAEPAAPKRRTTRKKADAGDAVGTEPSEASAAAEPAAPKRRTTRKKADPA